MKICTKCKLTKELTQFYKETNKLDGLQNHCKSCDNDRKKVWASNNPELTKKYAKQAELNRRDNEERKKYRKELRKLPHVKVARNASYAKRRAAKINRTPKWLTERDYKVIKAFYSIAQMLSRVNNEEWHVDHSIPLQGKLVSGLHVPLNLRLMRGIENETKRNTFEIT